MKEIYRNRVFRALIPFSYIYKAFFFVNLYFRRRKIFLKNSVFTVSVGNIQIGGTGKTPIEEFLISKFIEEGFKSKDILLVSRGYKKREKGEGIFYTKFSNPNQTGDETFMLMNKFSIMAISSPKREMQLENFFKNCRESEGVRVLILDDAYQYVGINRDVNIAVVDVSMVNFRQHGKFTLPAVFLREPVSSLKRADAIVLTKHDSTHISENNVQFIRENFSDKKIFEAVFTVQHIHNYYTREKLEVRAKKVLAFSALSDNEKFFDSVGKLGGVIVCKRSFPDHHNYRKSDIDSIFEEALKRECSCVVTSEKDAVKASLFIKLEKCKEMFFVTKLDVEAQGLAEYVIGEAKRVLKKGKID